ncbi:von Willebrand factor A domain-containing protein 7 [Alosa pseudoharengus]|uniref:von Willebrand factor A domain-containing protein 7 n=1 Tax=Alosa pseudoharengus TaxID=34774 RepID=UPI003F8A28FC
MVWRGWEAKPWIRLCVLGLLLVALPGCQSFLPNFWSRVLTLSWDSYTHQYMTEQAILNVTMETLKGLPGQHHSGSQRHEGLGRGFWRAVGEVVRANAEMDFLSATRSDPIYHFDSERVDAATEMLREFWNQSVLLAKAREYQGARHNLGQLFHSLQDFYSHSNWVEMGQKTIYQHLLDPKATAIPTASEDIHTCEECHLPTCKNNILKVMHNPKFPLLTTGYFSDYPMKPPGKCSHGGILDSSRHQGARGGINKDSTSPFFSPHHYLHAEAAKLATMATLMVLRDLRDIVEPKSFLRLFSVRQPPALVFVIDTTGSMFEEISAARLRAYSIIQARARDGGHAQPGTFLLVPFHDPGVGPVYETDDPAQFLHYLDDLTALGGGDEPEMCFTAIQLALTNSPPLSEIFVFTDASAKDRHLYNSVEALTLEKQSKVTFLLTEDTKRGMRRRRETLSPDRFSLYTSLASVSGGLTIFTSNKDIEKVSAIVQDTIATASKVTLLHAESHVDPDCSHAFQVDRSMSNVTLHLAGAITDCTLISPNGHTQPLLGPPGPLAELQRLQGLYRVTLWPPIQQGQWHITAKARGNVTFSVIGDSSLDFLYYLATEANETHPGLSRVEGSPIAGLPVFLVLAVTGLSPAQRTSFSHVTLMGAGGKGLQNVALNSTSSLWTSEQELVGRIEAVPHTPFCVHLFGRDGHGNTVERVSSEMIQPTHVQIQVLSSSHLVPGHNTSVAFEVWNHGPARSFSLSAMDDHGYLSPTGPYSFHISERSFFSREVVLKTPRKAAAGEAITLTLMVRARDSADSNYAVVHLTVIPQDNDTSPPSCSAMLVQASCPEQCSLGNWSVSLAVKDRGHSGLAAVQLSQGKGTLQVLHHGGSKGRHGRPPGDSQEEGHGSERDHMVAGDPRLSVTSWAGGRPVRLGYVSACCAPTAELVVWDRAGNSRRCHLAARQQSASPVETNRASRQPGHPCQGLGLFLISLLVINM